MAHKALVSGTSYSIKGGKTLIGGTSYNIKQGKTLIGGSSYTIPFTIDPIYVINDGRTDYGWTAKWPYMHEQGYIQYGATRLYAQKFINNSVSSGQSANISCDTNFDLTKLKSVELTYAFDTLALTYRAYFYIGSYSYSLRSTNWTTVTINCGAQSANSSLSFSWIENSSSDQIVLALNQIKLVF